MTPRRPLAPALCTIVMLVMTGCAGNVSHSAHPLPSVVAKHAVRLRTGRLADADVLVRGLIGRLVDDYSVSHWKSVRALFSTPSAGNGLVSQLTNWQAEGVRGLRAAPVSLTPLGSHRYAATIEFRADPRAIPAYDVYELVPSRRGLLLSMPISGLRGASTRQANWSITRTAHYRIYHSPYELLGSDRRFLAGLEHERAVFVQKFGIQPPKLTKYYYYPQQTLMRSFTGGACGSTAEFVGCTLSNLQPPEIHTSEWPSYHEPIHVFQIAMEPHKFQAPEFISEGMAVALEDRELDPRLSDYCSDLAYIPLDDCAVHAVAGVHAEGLLSDHGFSSGDLSTSYLMAGSFVKYLIETYGYHRFGRFYYVLAAQPSDQVRDYNVAANYVYGTTIVALLGAWRSNLCAGGRC